MLLNNKLFNKKSMLTLFAGLALVSASGFSGIKAMADDGNTSYGDGAIGGIDENGNATNNDKPSASSSNSPSKVSGQSDAHIRVVNGYLVLETVPSLGFEDVGYNGSNKPEKSNRVVDNDTVLNTDTFYGSGNGPQDLFVIDSRSNDKTKSGYSVNASLGKFGTYKDGNGTLNTSAASLNGSENKFNLELNGSFDGDSDQPNDGDGASTITPRLDLTSDGSSKTVLSNNSSDSGDTKVDFNSGSFGHKTSLSVPGNVTSGQYAAPITWTLAPTASAINVNGGGTAKS